MKQETKTNDSNSNMKADNNDQKQQQPKSQLQQQQEKKYRPQQNRQQKPEFMTRIVIRQLPPTMNKEQFVEIISPLPENNEFYYVNGDLSLGEYAFSRAYIKFKNIDDLLAFKQKYDNYIFIDQKGNEYQAIVEYAPMQKLPRRLNLMNIKKDSKMNTIESDPDFVAFKENIEAIQNGTAQPPTSSSSSVQQINNKQLNELLLNELETKETNCPNDKQISPLVEYLNKKRLEKYKFEEEKKRKKIEMKKKKKEETRSRRTEKNSEKKKSNSDRKQSQTSKSSTMIDRKTVVIISGNNDNNNRKKNNDKPSTSEPVKDSNTVKDQAKLTDTKNETKRTDSDNQSPKKILTAAHKQSDKDVKSKDSNSSNKKDDNRQKIRNKDRPALEIYRPGMARNNQQQSSGGASSTASANQIPQRQSKNSNESKSKDQTASGSSSNNQSSYQVEKPKYKYRVFTRSKN